MLFTLEKIFYRFSAKLCLFKKIMMLRINDIQSGIEEKILSKNFCSFIPSISDCSITQQLHIGRVARLTDISIVQSTVKILNISTSFQLWNKSKQQVQRKSATGNYLNIRYFYILIIQLHEMIETSVLSFFFVFFSRRWRIFSVPRRL